MSRVDVTLGVKNAKFRKGMEQAKGQVKDFRGVASKGFNFGQAAGIGALLIGLDKVTEKYDRVHKLSLRFGLDAKDIQQLGFAAEQNGASMELIAKAMAQANRSGQEAGRGLKTYSDQFEILGINVAEFNALDQKSQFLLIADAVANASDQNAAMAATQQLLGRSGLELIPMLKQGSAAIREQAESITALGNAEVAAMAKARDDLNQAKTDITGNLGIALAYIIRLFKTIVSMAGTTVSSVYDVLESAARASKRAMKGQFSEANEIMKAALNRQKGFVQKIKDNARDALDTGATPGGSGTALPGGVSPEALSQQQQANKLTAERLRLEKELAALQESAADKKRTSEEKVAAAQREAQADFDAHMDLVAEREANGSSPALENKILAAEIAAEKALQKVSDLKEKLATEVKTAADAEVKKMMDDYRAGMEKQIDDLKDQEQALLDQRDSAQRRAGAFSGGVDRLQALGLGAAGVNYAQDPEAARQTRLAVERNKQLEALRREMAALEVTLEPDEF
ncbi:MAG: hypothetical protein ACPG32_04410 [Akkermansiaceae bacterium]